MAIYVEKYGNKVRYKLPYIEPTTGRTKRVSIVYPKDTPRNKQEAERLLLQKIDKLLCVHNGTVTIESALDIYSNQMETALKQSTFVRNTATLRRIARKIGSNKQLNTITVVEWKDCLNRLSEGNNGTYNEYIRRLKTFLRWAYNNDLLEDNKLIDKLTFLPDVSKREKVQDKYLEKEEIESLLNGIRPNERYYYMIKISILSGLRAGELLALTVSDISDSEINVDKTLDVVNDVITTPKTFTSIRSVYMQQELKDTMKNYLAYRTQHNKVMKIKSDYLFCDDHGKHIDYYTYNKFLKENALRYIGREITTHALRHTSASLLLANGVSIDAISRRLGHENSRVTREIYLHITKELKEKDKNMIDSIKLL